MGTRHSGMVRALPASRPACASFTEEDHRESRRFDRRGLAYAAGCLPDRLRDRDARQSRRRTAPHPASDTTPTARGKSTRKAEPRSSWRVLGPAARGLPRFSLRRARGPLRAAPRSPARARPGQKEPPGHDQVIIITTGVSGGSFTALSLAMPAAAWRRSCFDGTRSRFLKAQRCRGELVSRARPAYWECVGFDQAGAAPELAAVACATAIPVQRREPSPT